MLTNDPQAEDAIWNTLEQEDRRRQSFGASATPDLANRVGQIHRMYPSLPTGVKLSAAKGNLSDEQLLAIANKSAPISGTNRTTPKKNGLFDNLMSNLKTASRYTFAALNLPSEMVQGATAQIFDTDDSVAGWFIQTELGSLIANDEQAGTGFFIGGRAKELQAERARRFRGEIDGRAFTIGRGLASTFLKDDTVPYRLLSGALDAGVAIATPAIPLASQVGKAARIAEEAGVGGRSVAAVAEASRLVGKGSKEIGVTRLAEAEREAARVALREEAGLLDDSVDIQKAQRFFTTGFGRRIVERTAETKNFAETWNLWGRKLDPETVMRLTAADTPQKVQAELLDVLGTEVTSTANIAGGRKIYTSLAQRNKMLEAIPFGEGFSRAFAKLPKHNINLFQAETPREQILELETLDRTLKLFKTDLNKRTQFINRAGKLLVSKDEKEIGRLYDDLETETKAAMERFGTHKNIINNIYANLTDYRESTAVFNFDDLGNPADMGLYARVHGLEPDADSIVYSGGQTTSELGKREFFVPDPKQVRRLTNNYNWLWVKKDPNLDSLQTAGQLRLPLAAVEYFQEQIWRKYITATIGNFVRNTVDSTISIALSGKRNAVGVLTHPIEWMSLIAGGHGRGTLLGSEWEDIIRTGRAEDAINDLANATGDIVGAYYQDPLAAARKAQKLGIFKTYIRPSNKVDLDVARAHGDEIGRLNADWAVRSMAAGVDENGVQRGGMTVDQLIDEIRGGNNPEATKWFNQQKQAFRNGKQIFNTRTREVGWNSIDLDEGDNLRYLLESFNSRLQKVTGNDPTLNSVVHFGYIPDEAYRVTVDSRYIQGELRKGGRVEYTVFDRSGRKTLKKRQLGRVVDIDERTGKYTVAPYAFDGMGDNTTELQRLLTSESIFLNPNMPSRVVGEIRDPSNPSAQTLKQSMDRMFNKFHSTLYTKPISKLERAPLFKSLYYGWVDKLAVSMDETSLNKIMDDIVDRSNGKPETFLTEGLWAKLVDLRDNPDKLYGTLTADEVSSFASASAIDEYMKTVYNAVERRNTTDILRVLSPFAQQQAEFFGRMARFGFSPVKGGELGYLPNAEALRKVQLIAEGGRDADPDGDGRGFFYKDPNTGQMMFTFPMSGAITKMFTGLASPIVAPLRGIALGLDYRPGLGPFATVAASAILPDSPSFDSIRKVMLPYGERTSAVGALTPSWITKIYDGVTGKTDGRFFANTYAETMQAVAATGKYDLSDPNQRDQMLEEARNKAQWLSILRGVSQFTGPAAGDMDIKTVTEQGDVYASGLAAALQSLRNINYDTATLRFIEIFGDDAFTYLSNKTVSEVGGLEGSKEFGVFERNNEGLFRQYREVAGFFGPVGTDFDFEVYTRQLQTGARRRLAPEEMVKAAETSIGLAYYKDMKNHLGPVLTSKERSYLANYRKEIAKKYPGFGQSQYDPNETPRRITALFDAARRDDLADNPVAKAARYYEQIRGAALTEARNRGYESLKSPKLADLHDYLRDYADILIEDNPEFARVFERLLSQELE